MIPKLFLSFVRDILKSLGASFFSMPAPEKEIALKNLDFDGSDLLKMENEEDLFQFTKTGILSLVENNDLKTSENPLLLAFGKYLASKIIPLCDQIPTSFFIAQVNEKEQLLGKIFSADSSFTALFKPYLKSASNEELNALFTNIFKSSNTVSEIVIVQSARECSTELKSEIRSKYGQASFVVFQVNSRLLGGVLIYKSGKIADSSWLGKVTSLRQLTRSI